MRVGMALSYAGGFTQTVDELADYEHAGLDIVFVRGVQLRRGEPARLPRGENRAAADRIRHPAAVLAYPGDDRDDRGRARLRVAGPVLARHRCVWPAGDRGLARRAVRRAARPDPRDHRDLPHGVAPGAPAVRRQVLPAPPPGWPGHRARQAAQADQPPGPRADPDPARE